MGSLHHHMDHILFSSTFDSKCRVDFLYFFIFFSLYFRKVNAPSVSHSGEKWQLPNAATASLPLCFFLKGSVIVGGVIHLPTQASLQWSELTTSRSLIARTQQKIRSHEFESTYMLWNSSSKHILNMRSGFGCFYFLFYMVETLFFGDVLNYFVSWITSHNLKI